MGADSLLDLVIREQSAAIETAGGLCLTFFQTGVRRFAAAAREQCEAGQRGGSR